MNMLDELSLEALDELSGTCRTSGLSTIGTHAQPPGLPFGNWCGWSLPSTLRVVLSARPPDYFRTAGPAIYRINFPSTRRPYIGQTEAQAIAPRIRQHLNSGGEARVRDRMRSNGQPLWDSVTIQAGFLRRRMSIRETHGYEIWLQKRERAFDWSIIQNTRPFE